MKESAEQSYLSDADEMKLSERFYFFDTDLFQRIQKEEKRLQETIMAQVVIEEDKELLDKQQSDLDRLRRIQKKLRDEQLDNVKDLLFPASGLIPSLGLLGLANLSVIISPLVTLMFSGAFFCSHIYKKGFHHTLSVLFGISTAFGMTSLVLSVIVLTGLAAINPVVVPVLMFATGLLLFFTAVERGRRRQQMVLKTIMPHLRDLLGKFSDVVSKVQQLRQNKDPSDEAVERFVLGKGNVRFGQEDSKLMRGIKQMKSIYVMILFQADHIENLLRTVKNPIEKRQRLKEMKDIIQGIKNGGFPGLDRGIVTELNKAYQDMQNIYLKDLVWLSANITLKAMGILGSAFFISLMTSMLLKVGVGVTLAPLVLNPVVLGIVFGVTVMVTMMGIGINIQKKISKKSDYDEVCQDDIKPSTDSPGQVDSQSLGVQKQAGMFLGTAQSETKKRQASNRQSPSTEKTDPRSSKKD